MLNDIKGIGPKTIDALNNLGIYSVRDVLTYFPYKYNFLTPSFIENAKEDENILISGYVENPIKLMYIKKNLNKLSFKLNTNNRLINVVIFNRAFLKQHIQINKCISIIGKYNIKTNTFTASDIKLKPILNNQIEPVYHLNQSIKKANYKKILETLIKKNYYIIDYVPDYLVNKYKLMNRNDSIKQIHFPTSIETLRNARLSLVYEELFIFMLKINYLKMCKTNTEDNYIKVFDNITIDKLIASLPFTLTEDQVNAIEDIRRDFNNNKRMNRLLLGDVGSGKTIVSFIALYMNYLSGFKGIMMAPTEILAVQHYNNATNIFKNININIELLTSSTKPKERKKVIERINNDEIDILIGTHSVLNEEIKFKKLGLVITDEQHRFGVKQRKSLQEKGRLVDVLYMSATPIPRTLALTLFGDMDITEIKCKPSNRKEIITKVYKMSQIKEILTEMLEEIKLGHQVYVVAPLIDSEEDNLNSVLDLEKKMNIAFNKTVNIGILHGKLSSKEKDIIMNDFKDNKINILISTTVIEVGVDVKNATIMTVFNAERFGLATLHQLRGRIGRSDLDSKCFLVSDYDTPRLKILEESNDGFYISEKDFELRGSGDLFGVKQHGDMEFKIANLKTDMKILKQCQKDSLEFLNNNIDNMDKYPNQKEVLDSINIIN